MVDGSLFDSLEAIARSIRGSKDPFGGIQLILAGWSCPTCTHQLTEQEPNKVNDLHTLSN